MRERFLVRAIKNILQGNVQIIKQTALEMGFEIGKLFLRHLGKLPVGMQDVNVVKDKFGPVGAVDLYRFFIWADDSVFPDAALCVNLFF